MYTVNVEGQIHDFIPSAVGKFRYNFEATKMELKHAKIFQSNCLLQNYCTIQTSPLKTRPKTRT